MGAAFLDATQGFVDVHMPSVLSSRPNMGGSPAMKVKKRVPLKTNRRFSDFRLPSISFLFSGRRKGARRNVPITSHEPSIPCLLPAPGGVWPNRMEVRQKVSLDTKQDFITFRMLPILFLRAEEAGRGARQNGS